MKQPSKFIDWISSHWLDIEKSFSLIKPERIGFWTKQKLLSFLYDNLEISKFLNKETVIDTTAGPSGKPNPDQGWVASAIANGALHVWAPGDGYFKDYINDTDPDWTMNIMGAGNIDYKLGAPSGFDYALELGEDAYFEITNGINIGYTGSSFGKYIVEVVYMQQAGKEFNTIMNQQKLSDPDSNNNPFDIRAVDTTGVYHDHASVITPWGAHAFDLGTVTEDAYHQVLFGLTGATSGGIGNCTTFGGVDGVWTAGNTDYITSNTDPIKVGYRRDETVASGGLILCGIAIYDVAGSLGPNSTDDALVAAQYVATGI